MKRNASLVARFVRGTVVSKVVASAVEEGNESMGLSNLFTSRYAGMTSDPYVFVEVVNRSSLSQKHCISLSKPTDPSSTQWK